MSSYLSQRFNYEIFHSFSCILHHLRVYYELTKVPGPSWLDSSVGRALYRYHIGHGLESRLSLIFLGLNLAIAYVVCITAIITHVFINLSFYVNLNKLPYLETGSRINLSQVSCSPLSCWNCNLECWLTVARWDEYDGTAFHPAYNTFSLVVKFTMSYVQT